MVKPELEKFIKEAENIATNNGNNIFGDSFIDMYGHKRSIHLLIGACLIRNDSYDFVESLAEFYDTRGYLTKNQILSLLKIAGERWW